MLIQEAIGKESRGIPMKISYKKLWKMLIDKNMTRRDLRHMTGISTTSIAKMGKGENMQTDVLLRICKVLKCDITEIMEIEYDESDISSNGEEA
jgi:DNA-binding Xre family transcriptional regulator